MASVGSNQAPYEIIWEAFADTQSNPGPDQVGAFLKRFDINEPLPTLAATMNTTQNTLVLRLKSFLEIRNECAHTGITKITLTTSDVQTFCDLLEQMGTGIIAVLQATLNQPPYVAAPLQPQPDVPPPGPPPTVGV